jgi:hypothetical protein
LNLPVPPSMTGTPLLTVPIFPHQRSPREAGTQE